MTELMIHRGEEEKISHYLHTLSDICIIKIRQKIYHRSYMIDKKVVRNSRDENL